jgi:hypothetical protein
MTINKIDRTIYKTLHRTLMGPNGRIRHLQKEKSCMSYLQQYTKIIQMTTLQTYFSNIFIKIEASLGKLNVRPSNRQPTSAKFKIQCSFLLILWLKQVYSTLSDHILQLEVKVPSFISPAYSLKSMHSCLSCFNYR